MAMARELALVKATASVNSATSSRRRRLQTELPPRQMK